MNYIQSQKKEISIVFSVDDNYAPYLAVTIQSLVKNCSYSNFYAIYVLEEDISADNKRKIKLLEQNNLKITFVSVKNIIMDYNKDIFYLCDHFSISTYFRFFIPRIFKNLKTIIYCDCDAIFLKDPAELFNITFHDELLAVVHDTEVVKHIFTNKSDPYYKDKLKLQNPENYFQAGFLLMNIPNLIKFNFETKCIKKLQEIRNPRYVDQCILNSVCENKVLFLDACWNVENHLMIFYKNLPDLLPAKVYEEYIEALKSPKFLHFSGCMKPWQAPASFNAEKWWKYARMTPFYEEILYKNLKVNPVQQITQVANMDIVRNIKNYSKNRFNYYRCKLMANLTFGKMRKHYKEKKRALKAKIKEVRKFLKGK